MLIDISWCTMLTYSLLLKSKFFIYCVSSTQSLKGNLDFLRWNRKKWIPASIFLPPKAYFPPATICVYSSRSSSFLRVFACFCFSTQHGFSKILLLGRGRGRYSRHIASPLREHRKLVNCGIIQGGIVWRRFFFFLAMSSNDFFS